MCRCARCHNDVILTPDLNVNDEGAVMGEIRKTIRITSAQEDWVREQIRNGKYTTESELFRALIERAKEQQRLDDALTRILLASKIGDESEALAWSEVKDKLIARYGKAPELSSKSD